MKEATRESTDVISENNVNAKANTGEVTVSAKNVKFRTLAAKRQSLAV